MTYFFISLLVSPLLCNVTNHCETSDVYDLLYEESLYSCHNAKDVEKIDTEILDMLVRVEKEYDVPCELKGMLLSAACSESGYNPLAKGDRKFSKKRKALAIGILQMWPWWENKKYGYGIDRTNPEQAARAWMDHIVRTIPKVVKKCKYKTQERIWIAAWVTAIRAPKKEGRCRQTPKHLRLLKKWHKSIEENCNIIGC